MKAIKAKKILLIDDDPQVREVILDELIFNGFKNVRVADSGKRALQLIQETSFDLVISDLIMPGMNGIELYRNIKNETHRPSFALVTGSDLDDVSFEEADEIHVIKKPFDFEKMISDVSSILKNDNT